MSTLTSKRSKIFFLDDRKGVVCSKFSVDINRSILEPENLSSKQRGICLLGIDYIRVTGKIWEFKLHIQITLKNSKKLSFFVPIIIIDSNHGKTMLASQFKFGSEARNLYRICAAVLDKLIRDSSTFSLNKQVMIETFLGGAWNTLECLILDSGKILTLKPFFKDLNSLECLIIKQPCYGNSFFTGTINGIVDWKKMESYLFIDTCVSSGIDMVTAITALKEYLISQGDSLQGKRIIIDSIFISSYGLMQFLPDLLLAGAEVIVVTWEGIFNLFKKDLDLFGKGVIPKGSMVSIYKNDCDPVFVPRATYQLLHQLYPVEIKPDLSGPVGKRLRDDRDIDLITYMIEMFNILKMPLDIEPWKGEISRALSKSAGARKILKLTTPGIFKELLKYGIITDQDHLNDTNNPFDNSDKEYQLVELL